MALPDEVTIAPEVWGKREKKEMVVNEPIAAPDSTASSRTSGQNDDVEKHGAGPESLPLPALKRKLKSRHLQMIAIGQ
jgi:amino acid transporter